MYLRQALKRDYVSDLADTSELLPSRFHRALAVQPAVSGSFGLRRQP